MKRAGGWILGLLVVAAMAGGAWFVLRRVLNRETVTVAVAWSENDREPTRNALERGAGIALEEYGSRAGRYRVQLQVTGQGLDVITAGWIGHSENLLSRGDLQPLPLLISAFDTHPAELDSSFRITPGFASQGRAAVAWAKRQKAARAFVVYDDQNPQSAAIALAFRTAAQASGLDVRGCAWARSPTGSVDRVDDFLDTRPDLLFYAGEDAPYGRTYQLFSKLRGHGFRGILLSGEADPEVSFLATRPDLVDGTYLVSPFAPGPHSGPHVNAGYFAMKAVLEAIDRANSVDPAELRRAAAKLPYFDAQGRAALRKCALYRARNGTFEFVEVLE